LGSQAQNYTCISCATFRSDEKSALPQAPTNSAALGLDLTSLGVDSVPYSFAGSPFPIDAAYKVDLAGPLAVGVATMRGATASSGVARDTIVGATRQYAGEASQLDVGVLDVVADRSALAPPSTTPFPVFPATLTHSANTQASVSYAFSPEALHTLRANAEGDPGLLTSPPLVFTTLARYGTQYGSNSAVIDVAESIQKTPPALDVHSAASELWHFSGAAGYRSVGAAYDPLDGSFDPHAGERGYYAALQYTDPIVRSGFSVATFSVNAETFSDGIQTRDEAIYVHAQYPLTDELSLQSNDTIGRISVSQVGRVNGLAIPDNAEGRAMLPNGQYNLQFAYARGSVFGITGGYTLLDTQGCNTALTLAPQPCYAYRAPTAVGDLAWTPFPNWGPLANAFIEASLQGSTSTPFQTATDRVLRTPTFNYYDTTQSHVVRTAAFGTYLFKSVNSCSTLLLTSANRGGDVDTFASSAPVPGTTNTASLEIIPRSGWPALLVAYSDVRNQNTALTPNQTLFLVRAQFGLPVKAYGDHITASCAN
jgi:hypothetical protein